jgi:long-chain acyl-CoA synthetase
MQTPIRNGASKSILIADGIRASSLRTPHKTAITESSRSLTYRQLIDRIDRVSNLAHAELGLRHGDRAALMMRNRLEYMELVCGLSSAGVAVATIGPASALPEVRFLCEDSGARVLFVDAELHDLAMAAIPSCVERVIVMGDGYEALLENASSAILDVGVTENDIFSIPYTSGATGRPKGVMLSHRGRVLACYAMASEHGTYGPDDRAVANTPMFHGAGFLMALVPIFFGGSVEILPKFDIERLMSTIQRTRATSTYMVPTHFAALFSGDAKARSYDTSSLKALISGTAPLAQSMKSKIIDHFGDGVLFERYGTTETNIVTALRPADQLRKIACVGQCLPGTYIQIWNDDGELAGIDTVGELAVASPYCFAGYHNLPEATEKAKRGDWFITGDLAKIDAEGYLYIVDRKNDMIITGGENVYPREVEELLLSHPAVAECAVVGKPDAYWGEAIQAFVVAKSGLSITQQDLTGFCRASLAPYKVPKAVHFVDALPRNSMGKILRRKLRDAES